MINTADPDRALDYRDLHVAQRVQRISDGAICYLGRSQPALATKVWQVFRDGFFVCLLSAREVIQQFQQTDDGYRSHRLKTWPAQYDLVAAGLKPYELRRNDREYRAGDTLNLLRYDPDKANFTGEDCYAEVIGVLSEFDGLVPGFVILSIVVLPF